MASLDAFELDVLESVERGACESKGNIAKRTQELQSSIKRKKRFLLEFQKMIYMN